MDDEPDEVHFRPTLKWTQSSRDAIPGSTEGFVFRDTIVKTHIVLEFGEKSIAVWVIDADDLEIVVSGDRVTIDCAGCAALVDVTSARVLSFTAKKPAPDRGDMEIRKTSSDGAYTVVFMLDDCFVDVFRDGQYLTSYMTTTYYTSNVVAEIVSYNDEWYLVVNHLKRYDKLAVIALKSQTLIHYYPNPVEFISCAKRVSDRLLLTQSWLWACNSEFLEITDLHDIVANVPTADKKSFRFGFETEYPYPFDGTDVDLYCKQEEIIEAAVLLDFTELQVFWQFEKVVILARPGFRQLRLAWMAACVSRQSER